jgi:hypothetical protein
MGELDWFSVSGNGLGRPHRSAGQLHLFSGGIIFLAINRLSGCPGLQLIKFKDRQTAAEKQRLEILQYHPSRLNWTRNWGA